LNAKQIVASIGEKTTTPAGLIVPARSIGEQERKKVRLLHATWKQIRRAITAAGKEKIMLLPACPECREPITIVPTDPTFSIQDNADDDRKMIGKVSLRCSCTDREIAKGL
jgi:hypothetical protein